MKKILCFVAVLALIAGTAVAANLNDGLSRQVYAQSQGRSVVSDKSVVFRVWYDASGSGTIGVSQNVVNLYHNGALTSASLLTYDTVEEVVEYIDDLANWEAAIGPDARPGHVFSAVGGGTKIPISQTTTTAGGTKESPTNIYFDSGTGRELSAGVEATTNKINRLKSITHRFACTDTSGGILSTLVYDDDTLIWREDISLDEYNTTSTVHASPNTITFSENGEKGISGSMGKSLVVYVSSSTALLDDYPLISRDLGHNVSIVYDQF